MMKIQALPFRIILSAFLFGLSLVAHSELSPQRAVKFFKTRFPDQAQIISEKTIFIKPGQGEYFEACEEMLEECFLLKPTLSHEVESYFDRAAEKMKSVIVVFRLWESKVMQGMVSYLVDSKSDNNFALRIDNIPLLSEILRNVLFYSNAFLPGLLVAETDTAARDTDRQWFVPFLAPTLDGLTPISGARVSLMGFSNRSAEIFDAVLTQFLKNPKIISKTPFSRDGKVKLALWKMWADTVLEENTSNVIADRRTGGLDIKRGMFATPVQIR